MGAIRLRHVVNKVRIAALVATVGPIVATLTSVFVGRLDPGYSPIQTSVSRLAEVGAPGAGLMNFAIGLLGVSLLALAFGMASADRSAAPIAPTFVGAAGVALLIAAAIRIDPGNPAAVLAHRIASAAAFAALALAQLAAARLYRGDRANRQYRRASLATGLLSAFLLGAGVGLLFDGFPGGLWERAVALLAFVWAELSALRLMVRHLPPARPAARSLPTH